MIYEIDTNPIERAKNIETYYLPEEDNNEKYKDLGRAWTQKKERNYRLLLKKRKLRVTIVEQGI